MTHFWLDKQAQFLKRLEEMAPGSKEKTRIRFALLALRVRRFEDWPGEFGKSVGIDPATDAGMEAALKTIRTYYAIVKGTGEMPEDNEPEKLPVVDEVGVWTEGFPEASAVTFTNLRINGVPVNATARWACSLSDAVLEHIRQLRFIMESEEVRTMDVCDKNDNVIRRVKGEPDAPRPKAAEIAEEPQKPAQPTKQEPAKPQGGATPATKGQVKPFNRIVKGKMGNYDVLLFMNGDSRQGHVFFPKDASKPSKAWKEIEEGTLADWYNADQGAQMDAEGSITQMPGEKLDKDGNPYMNVIKVTLK